MFNNKILQSDDYALFTFSGKNRAVLKGQVEKIKKSIWVIWYINQSPILVDKDLVIIDWQHRSTACKELGLPIFYQIVEWDMDKIMIELNASQKNWGLIDFINHYAEQGKQWYVYFLHFQKKYDLSITSTLAITTDSKSPWKKIKSWEWYEVYFYADILAEMANRLVGFVEFAKDRTFLRALVRVYIRGWVEALQKLENQIIIIPKQINVLDYCVAFENILNKNVRGKKRIDLLGQVVNVDWIRLNKIQNQSLRK